jgi:transposase InsO family protein
VPEEASLRSGDNLFAPRLARGAQSGARHGDDRPRPTLGGGHHFHPAAGGVCVPCRRTDAFSRRAVGWALDTHLAASLAIDALEMAIAARRPSPGSLIHHSDRGVQYACGDYAAVLEAHGIQASMSRVGNPYDNAKAESFMKTLKQEEVDGRTYRDANQARQMIASFIEQVYNRQRLHSALAYQSPIEFEANLRSQEKAAQGATTTASRSLATALWGARSLAACCAESNHQPGSGAAANKTPIATCP